MIDGGIHRALEEGGIQNAGVPVMRQHGVAAFSPLPALPVQDIIEENRNYRDPDRIYELAR
jgi:hypothetical protein